MLVWATLAPVTRYLKDMPQSLLAFIRLGVASLVILGYILIFKKNIWVEKGDLPQLILASVLAGYLPPIFYTYGVKNTTAIIGAVLLNSNPLFVPFFSYLIIKEKLIVKRVLYLIIGVLGIVFLSNPVTLKFRQEHLYGIIYLLVAALSVALSAVLSERLVRKYGGFSVGAYYIFIGTSFLFAHTLFTGELGSISNLAVNQIIPSVYMGIFPTALTWILFLSSLKVLKPTEASTFKLLVPPLAAVYAILFLGEVLTLNLVTGGILVIASIYLVQKSEKGKHIELD